jgi:hypothetical protein
MVTIRRSATTCAASPAEDLQVVADQQRWSGIGHSVARMERAKQRTLLLT